MRSGNEHQNGFGREEKQFPKQFASIKSEHTLAANNAQTDPRTSDFSERYLKPLEINSMLDVPIWVDSKIVGVICQQDKGLSRKWSTDEETFSYLMANIVAIAFSS